MSDDENTQSADGYTLTIEGGDYQSVPTTGNVELTATLTKGSTPCQGEIINFSIIVPMPDNQTPPKKQPYLNDGLFTCDQTTDPNGQAKVTVYDGGPPATVIVQATYETPEDSALSPQDGIEFVAPKADTLDATVNPGNQAMGGIIEVTATVTSKNNPVQGVKINFSLPHNVNGAQFCDKNGTTAADLFAASASSDSSGKAITYIRSDIWCDGYVTVALEDKNSQIDDKDVLYIFDYNTGVRAIFNDTVVYNGPSKYKKTANSGSEADKQATAAAPADGACSLEISGWVDLGGQALKANPSVTLTTNGKKASFDNHDPDNPNQITVRCDKHPPTTGPAMDGYFTATLRSTLPEDGEVYVTINRAYDNTGQKVDQPPPPQDNTQVLYSFVDPWSDVNNIKLQFPSITDSSYSIYANGRHQAPVVLSFDLCAAANVSLSNDLFPDVGDVIKTVQFLDYTSDKSINMLPSSSNPGWEVDTSPNAWNSGNLADSRTTAVLDDTQSGIDDNGHAVLYFYIRCNEHALPSPLALGVMISPTGSYLDNSMTLVKADPVNYWQGGKRNLDPPCQIIPVAPPQLSSSNLISTCTQFVVAGQQDDTGPANIASDPEFKANYYRQFDYQIRLSQDFKDMYKIKNVTYSAVNLYDLQPGGCYSSIIQNLYDYRLYVWPTNIDGIKFDPNRTGRYPMKSNINYEAGAGPLLSGNGVIYVSRYIGFGATCHEQFIQTDINLEITDDYGNTYPFYLPADSSAPPYDPTAMKEWNPALAGRGTRNSSNTTSTAANYTVGGVSGVNISKRGPVVINPPADASDPDLLYQNVLGGATTTSLTITLNNPYFVSGLEYISPLFYMTFVSDDNCQRSIIYDKDNHAAFLVCAPGNWTSPTTVRGVTLRPIWSSGSLKCKFMIGVNPNLDVSSNEGAVLYASAAGNNMIPVQQWSPGNQTLIWQIGTAS